MVVLFEFLSDEPMENVITCLNYKVDKVVYFGYHDIVQKWFKKLKAFLVKNCDISAKNVIEYELSSKKLPSIISTMRQAIYRELGNGNSIYFDITGGEDLILIAFGKLSYDLDAPMHKYDVLNNKLIEIDEGAENSISQDVEKRVIKLNLDNYIELKGGLINYNLQKSVKDCVDDRFFSYIDKLWGVANKHWDCWNYFSDFMHSEMDTDSTLTVSRTYSEMVSDFNAKNYKSFSATRMDSLVKELVAEGLICDYYNDGNVYTFRYANQDIKSIIWEGGSILELYTYRLLRDSFDDCRVGIHLDWDGVIHKASDEDVYNEIDVLGIKDNIPAFISCKSGKLGETKVLPAFYELNTVAERFGGKYCKQILYITGNMSKSHKLRAEEMKIEVKKH